MNIFEQDRRRSFLSSLKIESRDMLDLYRLMKSVDLHVKGDFDITQYGRLQTLKEESFQKESADFKQAVMIVYQNVVDDKWRFKHAAASAIELYLNGEPRASTCRKMNFAPEKVESYPAVLDEKFNWFRDGCFMTQGDETVALNPLFGAEVSYINNFKRLISWYNTGGTVNLEFFRTT